MNNSRQKKIKFTKRVRSFLNLWKIERLPKFSVNQFLIGNERWLVLELVSYNKKDLILTNAFNPLIARIFHLCSKYPDCNLFWFSDYDEMYQAFDSPMEDEAFLFIVLIG